MLHLSVYLYQAAYFHVFVLLFSVLLFQLERLPLAVFARPVINSLSFCLSGKVFTSSFFKESFARYSILDWQLFLSSLWIYYPTAFWPCNVSAENMLTVTCQFPCTWLVTFLLLVLRFSLQRFSLVIICLSVGLLGSVVFGILWAY